MRFAAFAAVSAAFLLFATGASAEVTIGGVGSGIGDGFASEAYAGQTFVVPAGVTRLDTVRLGITGTGTFALAIQRDSDYGSSTYVQVSPTLSVNTTFPSYDMATFRIPGGLPVTPGQRFYLLRNAISGDPGVVGTATDFYGDGDYMYDGIHVADDAPFIAVFDQAVPEPFPVPTLSEWALILFGALLASSAALLVQHRFKAV